MSEGEKRCDCCGEFSDGFISSGRSGSVEAPDCVGAYVSWDCARQAVGTDGWKELYSRIRARRSAQPAVASEAPPFDLCSRVFVEGRRMGAGTIIGLGKDISEPEDNKDYIDVRFDAGGGNGNGIIGSHRIWRRMLAAVKPIDGAPIAAPSATVTCPTCGRKLGISSDCDECVREATSNPGMGQWSKSVPGPSLAKEPRDGQWRITWSTTYVGVDYASVGKGNIPASDALDEVENQLALVARLDFDLRMLKLLGQGWSRGDLMAHDKRKPSSP